MCFSAEASFGVCTVLLPVGAYCTSRAIRNDVRFLPLALTPVAFGFQQAAEGCVWLGLHHADRALVERGAVVFLFFAFAFWPFWIPFSLLFLERRRTAQIVLAALAALSLVWLWLYIPVIADPNRWLSVEIVHHSLAYGLNELPAFQLAPRAGWRVVYLIFICAPLFIARPGNGGGKRLQLLGGSLVATLFLLTYLIYWYAFTSVWCFFAALISLVLGYVFAKLPNRRSTVGSERPPSRLAPPHATS